MEGEPLEPEDHIVGINIRKRREELGLSVEQLADRAGCTDQAVRHWKSGRSEVRRKNLG